MGKGNSSKVDETKNFLTLGHSNWTICSLLNCFCSKIFSRFYPASPIMNHFFILQREEGRKQQGQKMGNGNSSKVDETKGFLTLGHSNWNICSLFN